TSAKSGDRSRTISMQVFASRQVATTLKSLSADRMLFKPHRTTAWRSAITTLTQRNTGGLPLRTCFSNAVLAQSYAIARATEMRHYVANATQPLKRDPWMTSANVEKIAGA